MAETGKTCDQRCVAMSKAQHNEYFPDPSSGHEKKRRDREERQNIVLWRQPPITLQYFSLETLIVLKEWNSKWWHHQSIVVSSSLLHAVLMAHANRSLSLQKPFQYYLEAQPQKLHHKRHCRERVWGV
ncbi:hypothetical protein U0070_017702 [Myodes glareolus]|uniref:Uncharacterized protein n=1 Tax=Myodes glareolus TaxID=447135 RepID=A0AAW0K9F7_MYOGA